VLVTRPAHQAEPLCRRIEAAGGTALRFPTLRIAPPADPAAVDHLIEQLDHYRIAIFVSPNAVAAALDWIEARLGALPEGLRLATVGRGSARALEARLGRGPDLCPETGFDSEALLALPEMQEVDGQRIMLFKGEGGRPHLAETLRTRGAILQEAVVYRRLLPEADPAPLLEAWERDEMNVVVVTSNTGLENLCRLLGTRGRPLAVATPLVVVSERGAQRARELGWRTVTVAPDPHDEGLFTAIAEQWRQARRES